MSDAHPIKPENRRIGGFLPLELPLMQPARSAWQAISTSDNPILTGPTARHVLAQLLRNAPVGRIWFPAYCCPEMVLAPDAIDIRFYPVGRSLQPDSVWLAEKLQSGDAVLGIDYFGQSPDAAFRALVTARPDIFWIEDCAQALAPDAPWGDWQIFSPRKLFGVADGGVARCLNPKRALPAPPPCPADQHFSEMQALAPLLWRLEDQDEMRNETWYAAFKQAEAASATPARDDISALSTRLLRAIDADQVAARRLANARALFDLLPEELWFWQTAPVAPPLGVPILLPNRDDIATKLAQQGLFCAVHWRNQPAPAAEFSQEHALSDHLLTLPCDQRYTPDDMQHVARLLRTAL